MSLASFFKKEHQFSFQSERKNIVRQILLLLVPISYCFWQCCGSGSVSQRYRTDPKPSVIKQIVKSEAWICGSGSVPKFHKSATLVSGISFGNRRNISRFWSLFFSEGRSLYSWALLKFLDLDIEAFCVYCSALPTRGERPGSSKWSSGGEPFTYYRSLFINTHNSSVPEPEP